jgi:hypothetical protein
MQTWYLWGSELLGVGGFDVGIGWELGGFDVGKRLMCNKSRNFLLFCCQGMPDGQ